MTKNMNASIVVATYNGKKTIEKTLDSLLSQKFDGKYEIIVIDDGSTDGTSELLDKYAKYKDKNKLKVFHQKNSGVCAARNLGIKKAKYEIVVNMDHDCIAEKDWLEKIVAGFDSEKIGVVTSYGGYGGTSTAFRRSLLTKVGGYDPEYKYYREDTDLTFKIMDLGYEFKQVEAKYFHDHKETKPKGVLNFIKYVLKRLEYHQNDVLLYKKHPTKACRDFLHIKYGFIIDPLEDFKVATGLWKTDGKLELSSPRGITFIKNDSPLHALLIIISGICYVLAVKTSRLIGSIKFKKLLI